MSTTADISTPCLRRALNGNVVAPGDPKYDDARTVFYGGIDRRPAAIARVADDGDVAHVIALASETGLERAVRSGGHSIPGHSTTEGGIVLDLRETWDRLVAVKRRYDPTNLFRLNQNIPPNG